MATFGDLRSMLQRQTFEDADEAALIELLRDYTDDPEPAVAYILQRLGYMPATLWRPAANPRWFSCPLTVMNMVEASVRMREYEGEVYGALNIGARVCHLHTLKTPLQDLQRALLPIRLEALDQLTLAPSQRAELAKHIDARAHGDGRTRSIRLTTMLSSIRAWATAGAGDVPDSKCITVIQEHIPSLGSLAAISSDDAHFTQTKRRISRALCQLHMPRFQ